MSIQQGGQGDLVGPEDEEDRQEAADELVGPAGEQEHCEIAESVGTVSNLQRSRHLRPLWMQARHLGLVISPTARDRCACAPPPRTKWTRRVPHPVLTGHVSSLTATDLDRRSHCDAPCDCEGHSI